MKMFAHAPLALPQAYGKGVVSANAAYIIDSRPLRSHQGGAGGGASEEAALAGVVLTTEELVALQVGGAKNSHLAVIGRNVHPRATS
jgi:hypothetical protein